MLEDGRDALKIGYVSAYEPVNPDYGGTYYNIKTSATSYAGKHRTVIRGCSDYNSLMELYLPIEILIDSTIIISELKPNGALCVFDPSPTDCGTGKCCGTATKNRKVPDNVAAVEPQYMCGNKDETSIVIELTSIDATHG